MSPEYALEGLFSIKSDIFSFGVLLLEIVSGRKNTGFYQTDSFHLLGYVSILFATFFLAKVQYTFYFLLTIAAFFLFLFFNINIFNNPPHLTSPPPLNTHTCTIFRILMIIVFSFQKNPHNSNILIYLCFSM